MLHLGSGRPGFSLSVGRASLVFGAELTRTAGVLAVDRSSNPAMTDMTDACLLPSPLVLSLSSFAFRFLNASRRFFNVDGNSHDLKIISAGNYHHNSVFNVDDIFNYSNSISCVA